MGLETIARSSHCIGRYAGLHFEQGADRVRDYL
jgi:hypothetical protein